MRLNAGQRRYLRKQPDSQGCQGGQGGQGGEQAHGAYRHVRALLDPTFEASAEGGALLRGASCVVGLHPDEATARIAH